ncbi:MAG TPA: response regulator [Candidatus Limnocylindrales bacterium]|nr:response regulator [Candidatus Limnocylindrales bacterium]
MSAPETASSDRLVLVVEDDVAILAMCRVAFERARQGPLENVRMVGASDLVSARRLVASEAPDLLVVDVRLPDGNGLDMIGEVRGLGESRGPKVIIASASVLPAERDAALAAGADRFLAKPYRPADLIAAVAELLDGRA